MTQPSASPPITNSDAAEVSFGVVAIDAASLAAEGDGTERWIQVTPRGPVDTRDGRHYIFEPERLVARFAADGIDLPLDFDHAIPNKAKLGDKADAVGWIKKLEARPDGTYAMVELLPAGEAALKARTHRFVSPTFPHTKEGLALWLHSFALVAAPALAMPAIASASLTSTQEQPMSKDIAKALGLAESADEAACLSAITTLTAGSVAKAVHDQALANLNAATQKVTDLTAQLAARDKTDHDAKVAALLDGALKEKKIVPAQRDQYAALCATAEGLAQVTTLLAATPATLQASNLDGRQAETGDVPKTEELLAKANAEIETARKAGLTLSLADAIVKVNKGID